MLFLTVSDDVKIPRKLTHANDFCKNARKEYNEKKGSIFDDDDIADSALSYLYNDANKIKTQSFLRSNGFPTAQQRAQNQQLYGAAQEQKQIRDLLKSTANNTLNPNVTKLDHGFLQGIYGDEEGDRAYYKMLSDASQRQSDMYNAFQGSPFEQMLNPSAPVSGYVQNQEGIIRALQPMQMYDASKQPENKQFPSGIKNRDYSDKGFWYVQGANDSTNGKTPNIAIQQDDKKYSKRTQDEIAIYSQIWMDAETAYDLGIINQYEKKSVQAYAHNQANEIRYRASNPFKSFFEDTIEFATFDLLLGDFSHATVHAADLSTGAIKKMYTNPDNLSLIIATGITKGFTGGNSRTLGSTKINGQSVRVDIEMPTGKSNGNIHIHVDGEKIFLNTVDDIQDLSKGIRKSDKVVDWIKKAFQLFNKLT